MPPDLSLRSLRNTTAARTPSPRGRALTLPSSLLQKRPRIPASPRKAGEARLDSRPSPSWGKTARRQASVGTPLSEDGYPHTHRSRTKAPVLPRGRSSSPSLSRARSVGNTAFSSLHTLPPVGQGAAASPTHRDFHSPPTPTGQVEPTSFPASQDAE